MLRILENEGERLRTKVERQKNRAVYRDFLIGLFVVFRFGKELST